MKPVELLSFAEGNGVKVTTKKAIKGRVEGILRGTTFLWGSFEPRRNELQLADTLLKEISCSKDKRLLRWIARKEIELTQRLEGIRVQELSRIEYRARHMEMVNAYADTGWQIVRICHGQVGLTLHDAIGVLPAHYCSLLSEAGYEVKWEVENERRWTGRDWYGRQFPQCSVEVVILIRDNAPFAGVLANRDLNMSVERWLSKVTGPAAV